MSQLLQLFIWLPISGFLFSLLIPRKKETVISGIAIATAGIHLAGILVFTAYWLLNGYPVLDIKHIVLFHSGDIEIFIDFYFDKVTAVFAIAGSLLAFVVMVFSRFYMHREEGFKRYFTTVILFFLSYNVAIFSGNFETMFIGWEVLGICSFLLIAFYRDRYLPVKNSLKVISVYRLADVCMILAMWMSHHLWHENITFLKMNDAQLIGEHLQQHYGQGLFIAIMIVIAASAKSAQLPFSTWLPRAMEGPTTSSAIFYGSLSVHLGVFLLLRTYPYWESMAIIKAMVIAIGICTCVAATWIGRVQSTVKTQIAYSSVAQIGLMFIEVALGFHMLALIHFAGNAFLRTYQLLVSPSVLSYLVHDMVFNFVPGKKAANNTFLNKVKNSIYILSVKEGNLDFMLSRFLWDPFKMLGKKLDFMGGRVAAVVLVLLFFAGLLCNLFRENIPAGLFELLPFLFSTGGLVLVIRAFSEKGDAIRAWLLVIAAQLYITLSVTLLNVNFDAVDMLMYFSGLIVSAVAGFICLQKIKAIDSNIELDRFHGYTYEYPGIGFVFLLSCLGLAGLPFTPTFIGIDLLFSHIHKHQVLLVIFTSISFMLMEISILRIYARIFMGQHKKAYHAIAYRSS
jgi:NADH-quinone oxidoreductase subunit L